MEPGWEGGPKEIQHTGIKFPSYGGGGDATATLWNFSGENPGVGFGGRLP